MDGDRGATDADRSLAIASLREAVKSGVLDIEELQELLDAAVRARTVGELATITWEARLPVTVTGPGSPAEPLKRLAKLRRNKGFRMHSTVYAAVNGFLIGTWALTGGLSGHEIFWPFFPLAGWGIGVAAHAAAVEHKEEGDPVEDGPGWVKRADGTWVKGTEAPAAGLPHRSKGTAGVRYVTVMFADVANSTALNEAIGDEAWKRLRTRHLSRLRECVAENDGVEVSTAGDGLFARFDLPGQAMGCAVEIQRRIEAELESTGFSPRVRIGIHAGEAVEDESDLIGKMVNLASRVAAVAEPGEICVTEPVADKVSDRFHLEDRGLHTLKGVARARHLLSVRW